MKIKVYKGFSASFLDILIGETPLLRNDVYKKKNVFEFDKKYRKQLNVALLELEEEDNVWITYEEYTLIKLQIDEAITKDGLQLEIIRNNIYPDYYPIELEMSDALVQEVSSILNGDSGIDASNECLQVIAIYNSVVLINNLVYGAFYNFEYDRNGDVTTTDFYPSSIEIDDSNVQSEYNIFLNDDVESYLRNMVELNQIKPRIIGLSSTEGYISKRIQGTLQALCILEGIKITRHNEALLEHVERNKELEDIAREDIGIRDFIGFKKIKFYQNPDIDKGVIEISQGHIIQEIIHQAECAYNSSGHKYRDVFITASTGAGKSVMFQIPAVYLAKKYNKLTIIIEPVKALMQDQKDKLNSCGYSRVEAFNSDLISQVEKEAVLERIRSGSVDLLYLSPETLLSYSIETIIGDREIGLLIIDEAHIVTTWGVGFRPDYWYLGGYINRLRNQIQTSKGIKRKTYYFPICAFTATAINGGVDDSVSDTIISLHMENPIKYLGYVRRDNIIFDICHQTPMEKLPRPHYEERKTEALSERIDSWLLQEEKTLVYFPYAVLAVEAAAGKKGFAGIRTDKRIGTYTGRNIHGWSAEVFSDKKRQTFEEFRNGTTPVMFATKAFGMGVDVNDIKNVYHYAVTGNLCDYVQEIGRVARKPSIKGVASIDNYHNDLTFMKVLFGMSQIKQYQIRKVIEGIHDTYKSKNESRSFLISPEAFTFIFNGKGVKDEESCINKLKTCLLMLEKDFYDKYNFKVLISRPQSIFTKSYVCIAKENEDRVLASGYGQYFNFVDKGRDREMQLDGSFISDTGDIYSLDLKQIWEQFHDNISFPQFKYWYFNPESKAEDKIEIMPGIRACFSPRQKVNIEARGGLIMGDIRQSILDDFDFIADKLYSTYRKQYFSTDEFIKMLRERYGVADARIIANSLFELIDPLHWCIKQRTNEATGKIDYYLNHGNLKELMRKPIIKSKIINNISRITDSSSYSGFISLNSDEKSSIALKLLSIFGYITYEVVGGEEPEIFIRLNDPNKIRNIALGYTAYSNSYVAKAKQKHERDVEILRRFFEGDKSDEQRWDYIENYFLGYDVLNDYKPLTSIKSLKMARAVDKDHSYSTNRFKTWSEIESFFDENDHVIINKLSALDVKIPEYLETALKKSEIGNDIMMSWPSKDVLICQQDASDTIMEIFKNKGWHAYRLLEIDYVAIKEELN